MNCEKSLVSGSNPDGFEGATVKEESVYRYGSVKSKAPSLSTEIAKPGQASNQGAIKPDKIESTVKIISSIQIAPFHYQKV